MAQALSRRTALASTLYGIAQRTRDLNQPPPPPRPPRRTRQTSGLSQVQDQGLNPGLGPTINPIQTQLANSIAHSLLQVGIRVQNRLNGNVVERYEAFPTMVPSLLQTLQKYPLITFAAASLGSSLGSSLASSLGIYVGSVINSLFPNSADQTQVTEAIQNDEELAIKLRFEELLWSTTNIHLKIEGQPSEKLEIREELETLRKNVLELHDRLTEGSNLKNETENLLTLLGDYRNLLSSPKEEIQHKIEQDFQTLFKKYLQEALEQGRIVAEQQPLTLLGAMTALGGAFTTRRGPRRGRRADRDDRSARRTRDSTPEVRREEDAQEDEVQQAVKQTIKQAIEQAHSQGEVFIANPDNFNEDNFEKIEKNFFKVWKSAARGVLLYLDGEIPGTKTPEYLEVKAFLDAQEFAWWNVGTYGKRPRKGPGNNAEEEFKSRLREINDNMPGHLLTMLERG